MFKCVITLMLAMLTSTAGCESPPVGLVHERNVLMPLDVGNA